ncbi:hypothetical protein [Paludisphaera soli]|uniref:hypothetical protein n=1 Tax=Paludisphaera soli TaxID=2712865 RepID=UPI0013ECA62F|nr:hypothetical protein [Paludisphaera soli]
MPPSRRRVWIAATFALAAVLGLRGYLVWRLGMTMDEMYGTDGVLERGSRYGAMLKDGVEAMGEGRYEDAERSYRQALKDAYRENRSVEPRRVGSDVPPLEGLGDALAAQGKLAEARLAFDRALAAGVEEWGRDDARLQEIARRRDAASKDPGAPGPTP